MSDSKGIVRNSRARNRVYCHNEGIAVKCTYDQRSLLLNSRHGNFVHANSLTCESRSNYCCVIKHVKHFLGLFNVHVNLSRYRRVVGKGCPVRYTYINASSGVAICLASRGRTITMGRVLIRGAGLMTSTFRMGIVTSVPGGRTKGVLCDGLGSWGE